MINPKTIGAEWVTVLRSLPNLVTALGGNPTSIQYYSENITVFGRPTEANVDLAILTMPPGSIMIVWDGSGPGRLGNAQVFVHQFKLYLRTPEILNVGYEDIWTWIINDIPEGTTLRMLHTQIDPNCEPMNFRLPDARRYTIVISADGTTFEYFMVGPVFLIESYNP
jgi:hypothetical protein